MKLHKFSGPRLALGFVTLMLFAGTAVAQTGGGATLSVPLRMQLVPQLAEQRLR